MAKRRRGEGVQAGHGVGTSQRRDISTRVTMRQLRVTKSNNHTDTGTVQQQNYGSLGGGIVHIGRYGWVGVGWGVVYVSARRRVGSLTFPERSRSVTFGWWTLGSPRTGGGGFGIGDLHRRF